MQTPSRTILPPDRPSRFLLVFEGLVWVLHGGMYKFSGFMEGTVRRGRFPHPTFSHPQLIVVCRRSVKEAERALG